MELRYPIGKMLLLLLISMVVVKAYIIR